VDFSWGLAMITGVVIAMLALSWKLALVSIIVNLSAPSNLIRQHRHSPSHQLWW